jgi:hypothetical protein
MRQTEFNLTMQQFAPIETAKGTQKAELLSMLRCAGSHGVSNIDMVMRRILNWTGRISELRKMGHKIKAEMITRGIWKYILEE